MLASGAFVWHDHMSTDPPATRGFYAALFGWVERDGRLFDGDVPVAGVVPLDPEGGWPSHWLSYVSVPDVDTTVGRVLALGGEALSPPTEVPGGRFAVIADPQGAVLALLHHTGDPLPDSVMGWNELITADDAVRRFYAGVFGYVVVEEEGWWRLERDGETRAALSTAPGVAPAYWLPYVRVPNAADCVGRARELGATVLSGPATLPGVGRYAVLADPQGAGFGVIGR